MISFIIYLCVLIFTILLTIFESSLEDVQYYSIKFLYEEYNTHHSKRLLDCVYSSALYSNENLFRYLRPNSWIIYTPSSKKIGHIHFNKNAYISFISTSNLEHVKTSIDSRLNFSGFHEGYHNIILSVINDIFKKTETYNKIIISGHSMGGALAGICSYELSMRNRKSKIYTYLFGSPKFSSSIVSWNPNVKIKDFINLADPVVYKPLNKHYIRVGTPIIKNFDTGNDNVNHSIKVYREIAENFEETAVPKRGHRYDEILMKWVLDALA